MLFNDEVRAVHPGPRGVAGVSLASGRERRVRARRRRAWASCPIPNFWRTPAHPRAERRGRGQQPLAELSRQCLGGGGRGQRRGRVAGAVGAGTLASARGRAKHARRQRASTSPGAHYFATRLFDLDFARIGQIERREGREELIDFPRGTGQIAYRKLVIEGGKLIGALMIGERALRVRAIGRNMKRLIDAAVDVSEIKHRLLDPSFDVEAWLERKRLVERPAAPRKTTRFRGSQAEAHAGVRA